MQKYRDMNEQQLLGLIKQGDTHATRELYTRHIGYLKAVCSRYVTGNDDVMDILHDGFVKIITSIDGFTFRGEGSLRSWMARIIANECVDFLRRANRLGFAVDEDRALSVEDEAPPDADDVPPAVLHDMIRQLPEGYRTVLNLYVFEERSHKEIAVLLGIKESSSASQFHRAKNILAKKIKEYKSSKLSGYERSMDKET